MVQFFQKKTPSATNEDYQKVSFLHSLDTTKECFHPTRLVLCAGKDPALDSDDAVTRLRVHTVIE